jgi:hypothetical protein
LQLQKLEAIKTWLQLQKLGVMIEGKQQEFSEKKEKKSDGGCSCKVLFSLFGVVKILSFMMIQPPSLAFNILLQFNPSFYHFSIQSLVKKNPSNQSRELGQKSFSRPGIPAFTLDIQTRIS